MFVLENVSDNKYFECMYGLAKIGYGTVAGDAQ